MARHHHNLFIVNGFVFMLFLVAHFGVQMNTQLFTHCTTLKYFFREHVTDLRTERVWRGIFIFLIQ